MGKRDEENSSFFFLKDSSVVDRFGVIFVKTVEDFVNCHRVSIEDLYK